MATIAAAILPGRRMSHGRLLLEDWEIGCSMSLPLSALCARFIPIFQTHSSSPASAFPAVDARHFVGEDFHRADDPLAAEFTANVRLQIRRFAVHAHKPSKRLQRRQHLPRRPQNTQVQVEAVKAGILMLCMASRSCTAMIGSRPIRDRWRWIKSRDFFLLKR